jgi:transcriptional regulator with XRE-family HTH domain
MINAYFDLPGFMLAVDEVRKQRRMTWYQIHKDTNVTASGLSQMRHGSIVNITSDTLAALALWSGVDVRPFMKVREEAEV